MAREAADDITHLTEANLVGGPQDGGRVHAVGGRLPRVVYVHARWMGDGYSAWGRSKTERFPCRYVFDGYKFKFQTGR